MKPVTVSRYTTCWLKSKSASMLITVSYMRPRYLGLALALYGVVLPYRGQGLVCLVVFIDHVKVVQCFT